MHPCLFHIYHIHGNFRQEKIFAKFIPWFFAQWKFWHIHTIVSACAYVHRNSRVPPTTSWKVTCAIGELYLAKFLSQYIVWAFVENFASENFVVYGICMATMCYIYRWLYNVHASCILHASCMLHACNYMWKAMNSVWYLMMHDYETIIIMTQAWILLLYLLNHIAQAMHEMDCCHIVSILQLFEGLPNRLIRA